MGGLLGDKEKDNLSQRFHNGKDNIQIAEYLIVPMSRWASRLMSRTRMIRSTES